MALSPSFVLLKTQTDERLVELAHDGHERAFEAIVERYRGLMLSACRRFLADARAEDALQQAFVLSWNALQRGTEIRDLRAWLYRIAQNSALNTLRHSGYDHEELQDSFSAITGEEPSEVAERRAVVRQTLAGLASLPERQREALLRLAVEGASQEEIARDLGLSEGAVRQLVFRARMSLRSAATAITPMPFAGWLAAGGLGAAPATAAVVCTAVVVAGGVVGAPIVFDHEGAERTKAGAQNKERTGGASLVAVTPSTSPSPDVLELDASNGRRGPGARVAAEDDDRSERGTKRRRKGAKGKSDDGAKRHPDRGTRRRSGKRRRSSTTTNKTRNSRGSVGQQNAQTPSKSRGGRTKPAKTPAARPEPRQKPAETVQPDTDDPEPDPPGAR